ncbi:MAG: acyl-CoA dehydrogenase family protein, partial [Candidatus Geothermarchaeales archaeon]
MVEFKLTEEQRLVKKTMHEFAENEMRPVALECDREAKIPGDVMKKAHELGITTFDLPDEWGGGGNESVVTSSVVAEELAWGCAGIWTSLLGPALAGVPIAILGDDEQKKRYLAPFCREKPMLGALALTEPEVGSDVKSISTTARVDGDEWVLNGTKAFITNGGIADLHVIFATVDSSLGYAG